MSRCLLDQGRPVKGTSCSRILGVALLGAMLSACGGGSSDDQPENNDINTVPAPAQPETDPPETDQSETDQPDSDPLACTVDAQKQWAHDSMLDYYLFDDQVPTDANLQSFETTSDVVSGLRYQERDPYSSVSVAAESTLLFTDGREFGLGLRFTRDANDLQRVTSVFEESPMGLAGIERGDIIVGIDGVLWDDLELGASLTQRVIGTPESPGVAEWQIKKNITDETNTVSITAAEYKINTVIADDVFPHPNGQDKIGYLAFQLFLGTSEAELNEVFSRFQAENVSELVLDLRYNGGGRVSVAAQLASLIVDNALAGELLYEYRFNDKYTEFNESLLFEETEFGLGLNRVVVLTSPSTASSSEIVIAGLQPYVDVVTLGGTTRGKPYISSPDDRCGERLNLMLGEGFNAENFSVYGGVEASCFANDDLSRNFGVDENGDYEGMLQAGIDYIADERSCVATPIAFASRSSSSEQASGSAQLYGPLGDAQRSGGAVLE